MQPMNQRFVPNLDLLPALRFLSSYLSVETRVLAYDLRNASAPIVREASQVVVEAGDDINQVVISGQRRDSGTFLAAADDTGIVQVLDGIEGSKKGKGGPRRRILEHGQDTLVTSCAFRPRSKNVELASGGTDCRVCLWDVNKPK